MNPEAILAVLPDNKEEAKSLKEIALAIGLVLTGYEAIAFAAAGYIFGKEVHRQQAENAGERADKAQGEAKEATAKGLKLAEAVKARASKQLGKDLQSKAIGAGNQQGDLDYLADMASKLYL